MVAHLLIGGLSACVVAWGTSLAVREQQRHDRSVKEHLEDAEAEEAEAENAPPRYESLRELQRREQRRRRRRRRRVRFASDHTEIPPSRAAPSFPAPWRSAYYEPSRQRFETIIVDGVYVRHGFSSSGQSIEGMQWEEG
ncbi:unnamed protein product [Ectocarpus sp. 6 AP-2014]